MTRETVIDGIKRRAAAGDPAAVHALITDELTERRYRTGGVHLRGIE